MLTSSPALAIRVGVVAGEPIRLEGLNSVFEREPEFGQSALLPVIGSLDELLADQELEYMVIDLNSSPRGLETLKEIRRQRPALRLIVIGPAGNDALVMDSIIGGARAYLDLSAGPRVVREAIEVAVSGSIWAPRRLLSRLIDRLLLSMEGGLNPMGPRLTARERQAHVGRLMRKTGAENRIDLSMRALNGPLSRKAGSMHGGGLSAALEPITKES